MIKGNLAELTFLKSTNSTTFALLFGKDKIKWRRKAIESK